MGNLGLALAWETRIPSIAQRGRRLEPFREQIAAPDRKAEADRSEDAALAAACRAGDLHAYERLYSLHGARMRNLARNILGSTSDAEDAVQETFLKVQRSIAGFRGQSSVRRLQRGGRQFCRPQPDALSHPAAGSLVLRGLVSEKRLQGHRNRFDQ